MPPKPKSNRGGKRAGAGRPPKIADAKMVWLRLSKRTLASIEATGVPVSDGIRDALRKAGYPE